MTTKEKVFSVQPRFKIGDYPTGWALVDGIFRMGDQVPQFGTEFRDAYLAIAWIDEPMTAGVFSTWVEKAQTINWKITGGKIQANYYASLLHEADGGAGWTWHEGVGSLDYLVTDKGSMEELGRESLTQGIINELADFYKNVKNVGASEVDYRNLQQLISRATMGRVTDISHLDSTRMIKIGLPGMRWRYFPDYRDPVSLPDDNVIQVTSMPSGRDRHVGYGHCSLGRLINAKQLMLGYLNYFRQEIGELPPELIAIINGLPQTTFEDALRKYKMDRKKANLDEYGKIFWIGNDDPMTPVSVTTVSMTSPNKAFNYQTMVEWWAKLLALNTGEAVGEYWLIQHAGATKALESIQALKARGKGVAKYLQEKERKYNMDIMPFGVRFEYDNKDDEQDKARADILAAQIANLKNIATIGVDRQEPAYSIQEIRDLAIQWEIIPPEVSGEEVPTVLGAMLKELAEETWTVDRYWNWVRNDPILRDKDAESARYLYDVMKNVFVNGAMKHKQLVDVIL